MSLREKLRAKKEVRGDAKYVQVLETLSHGSTNRNFDPFIDIDWDSPEYAVVPNDTRWVLPHRTDPLGGTPGTSRSRWRSRSRSGCGARPTWPRWDCTSRAS